MTGEEKQLVSLLRRCDVLADISNDAMQALLPGLTMGTYRPRQVIYLPGDRAQGVHFLSSRADRRSPRSRATARS